MNARSLSKRSLAVLLTTILLLVAIPVSSAFALTSNTLSTSNNGFYTAWNGSENAVDESISNPSCSSSDSITSSTGNQRESFTISLSSIPNGSKITTVTVLVRDRRHNDGGGGTYSTFVRLNGTDLPNGPVHTTAGSGGGDSTCTGSHDDLHDVPDTVKSGSTTLEIGVVKINSGGDTNRAVRVGAMAAIITYTQTPTLSITNSPVTYDGSPKTATVVARVGGVDIPGTINDIKYATSPTAPMNAGSYSVTADFIPSDPVHYDSLNDVSAGTFVINKANATINVTGYSVTYDGNPHTATGTATGLGSLDLSAGLNLSGTTHTAAGEYLDGWSFTSPNPNYNDASGSVNNVILPKQLTITGVTANDKAYDGTTSTTWSGTPTLVGVVDGDDVDVVFTNATANFVDPEIGTDKTVVFSGFELDGTDADNYTLVQPTGTANIIGGAATVIGIVAQDKVYDGNTNVTLDITGIDLANVSPNDDVDVDTNSISAAFADENAGTNKQVIITGLTLTGTDAHKYTLVQPTIVTADILPKDLNIEATAQNKVYDGTTAATVNITSNDIVPGDNVTFTYSAAFAQKDVGSGILVSVTGISLGGTDAANYNLPQTSVDTAANITKRPLTVTANSVSKKVGEPDPAFTFAISGFAPGETSSVLQAQPTCTVSVAHDQPGTYPIVCSGGAALNYSFNYVNGTLTVTPVLPSTPTFQDVQTDYWAWEFIERLANAGVTAGCQISPDRLYCPDATVTRAEMAVFLLRGKNGPLYSPPAVGDSTGFGDVATDHWAAAWIKQLAADGITAGCGNGNYCPDAPVTRAEMAVFLLKSKHGTSLVPAPATGVFGDVPTTHWAAAWIERLASEGITSGCGEGNYCPDNAVTRAEMAVFLVRTFNLP
jgi:hypothetical protein